MRITLKDSGKNGTIQIAGAGAVEKLVEAMASDDGGWSERMSLDEAKRALVTLPEGVWKRELTIELHSLPDSKGKQIFRALRLGTGSLETEESLEWQWANLSNGTRENYERAAAFLAAPPIPLPKVT